MAEKPEYKPFVKIEDYLNTGKPADPENKLRDEAFKPATREQYLQAHPQVRNYVEAAQAQDESENEFRWATTAGIASSLAFCFNWKKIGWTAMAGSMLIGAKAMTDHNSAQRKMDDAEKQLTDPKYNNLIEAGHASNKSQLAGAFGSSFGNAVIHAATTHPFSRFAGFTATNTFIIHNWFSDDKDMRVVNTALDDLLKKDR